MSLKLIANIADPDGFYEFLVDSQREMSEEEANRMNARLILILANHVGDRDTLREAIQLAAKSGRRTVA